MDLCTGYIFFDLRTMWRVFLKLVLLLAGHVEHMTKNITVLVKGLHREKF